MGKLLILRMSPDKEIEELEGAIVKETRNLYELPVIDLAEYTGLIISGSCDQIFLKKHQNQVQSWITAGGKALINGHIVLPFLRGLPITRKLDFRGLDDVWLSQVNNHPMWEGINLEDVVLRTGVPGHHTLQELKAIGVAGFYARAYLGNLPAESVIITGIGAQRLPVDISYRLGSGEVIVHNGNDLHGFSREGTSAQHFSEQIYTYLAGERFSSRHSADLAPTTTTQDTSAQQGGTHA